MTSHELLDELLKAEFRQLRIRNLAAEEEADGYSCCYRGGSEQRLSTAKNPHNATLWWRT